MTYEEVYRRWRERAERRAERHIEWKEDVARVDYHNHQMMCDGRTHSDDQALLVEDQIGYTQPCTGPAAWEVDGLWLCDKHLVQSGR